MATICTMMKVDVFQGHKHSSTYENKIKHLNKMKNKKHMIISVNGKNKKEVIRLNIP